MPLTFHPSESSHMATTAEKHTHGRNHPYHAPLKNMFNS